MPSERPSFAHQRARRRGGFTLIELMVTVAMVAIFATLAAPAFREMIAAQRLRAAASAFTESLRIARSESVKRNTSVGFTLTADGLAKDGWNIVLAADDTVLHSKSAVPTVSLESGGGTFRFNAYGRMEAGGASQVELAVAGTQLVSCVEVSLSGRPDVSDGACE